MSGDTIHSGPETALETGVSGSAPGGRQLVVGPGTGPPAVTTRPGGVDRGEIPSLAERVRRLPPERVLVFGKSRRRTRQTSGFIQAFEAQGCRVEWINMARLRRRHGRRRAPGIAERRFERFRPDLVFALFPDLPLDLMRRIVQSTPVAQWCEQVLGPLTEEQVGLFAATDLSMITNPRTVTELEALGVRSGVASMEGFSRTWHRRAKPGIPVVRDLCFVGSCSERTRERADFLVELAARHPLTVFGRGWEDLASSSLEVRSPVSPSGLRRVCAETRIVLGSNERNHLPGYWSDRTVLTLACGGFHLTHYVPGLEQVFEEDRHLAWFQDLDACSAKIDHYLDRPQDRARIAAEGHDLVHSRHRWHDRVADLLHHLRLRTECSGQLGAQPN